MPSAEKLPSGRWRGVYQDADKKKQRVAGTFPRKTDALEAAVEAQAQAQRVAATKAGTLSARTTWGQWWEVVKDRRQFDSDTGQTEKYIAKLYLLPRWSAVPLVEISTSDLQGWVNDLGVGRKPSYVRRIYALLSATITTALEEGVLRASPLPGVKLPKVHRRQKQFLTPDAAAAMTPDMDSVYADMVEFGLETGLRPGELAGLHANRVDFTTGWMTVAEAYVFKKRIMRPHPKDKDTRQVPLTDKAVQILKRRLANRQLDSGCGVPHTDDTQCKSTLVFVSPRLGRVVSRDSLYRAMRLAADKSGVPRRSPYAIRRGFATRAAVGGMDAFLLADFLGHETLKQAQEYVQQTADTRDRMRVALGEAPGLRVVGSHGTGRGTESSRTITPEPPSESAVDGPRPAV